MFKKSLLLLSVLIAVFFTACTTDVEEGDSRYVPDKAKILSTKTEGEYTKIVFEYPSVDPNDEPVGVSAIICMKTSFYNSNDKKADYTILVNHGATTKWDDVPSMGGGTELCSVLNALSKDNVIGVATDYMGLGHFKDEPQAFAYGEVNAAAALDALINARKLLKKKGFTWEDKVANIGFSQGGQTALCVQKLVDTSSKYKNIKITKTFAGDGVYDIPLIIDYSLKEYNPPVLPLVILLGIVSYDYWSDLGIDESKVFLSPDLIEKYVKSKNYGFVDGMTGMLTDSVMTGVISPQDVGMTSLTDQSNIDYNKARQWSNFLTKDMLNPNSAVYKNVLKAVKGKNNYWTPSASSNIVLFTADNDDVVPGANAESMFEHFKKVSSKWDDSCEIVESGSATPFSEDNVYIHYVEEPATGLEDVVHAKASSEFFRRVKAELAENW